MSAGMKTIFRDFRAALMQVSEENVTAATDVWGLFYRVFNNRISRVPVAAVLLRLWGRLLSAARKFASLSSSGRTSSAVCSVGERDTKHNFRSGFKKFSDFAREDFEICFAEIRCNTTSYNRNYGHLKIILLRQPLFFSSISHSFSLHYAYWWGIVSAILQQR